MTEREWLECEDVQELLDYLVGRASNRKFRLFGCACCRRVWNSLADERSRNAVAIAERYADGLATDDEIEAVRKSTAACQTENALRPGSSAEQSWAFGAAAAVLFATPFWKPNAASQGAKGAAWAAAEAAWRGNAAIGPGEEASSQLNLFRDIFENPYRPKWMASQGLTSTIVSLAQAIYDHRRFADLLILADALEEAGCTDPDVLDHCRQPGVHSKGCWVLDLVLGKE
jgi:hypothetical protein